jgi:hypothetical protein
LAIPAFSLAEPIGRVTRSLRDRRRLENQINAEVAQLDRSTVHRQEGDQIRAVPKLLTTISRRESARLTDVSERILRCTRQIALSHESFRQAVEFQSRFNLSLEDAIVLAVVVSDLRSSRGLQRHVFANKNRNDFGDPALVAELDRFGCDLVWSFAEAARRLGI